MAEAQKKRPTLEQINDTYKAGYLTAEERNKKVRQVAAGNLQDIIQNQGILLTYFTQTIKHVQESWDDFVKIADEYQKTNKDNSVSGALGEAGHTLKTAGRIMWDQIGALSAPFTAFAEVNGETAKRWAKDAGASDGLAKAIGLAVDVGSGFVPVGKLSQAFARGIQKNVPQLAEGVSKVASVGKAAEATQEASKVAQAQKVADEAMGAALKAEGINTGLGAEGDITKAITSSADDFYAAMRKFKAEMANVTATKTHEMTAKEAEKLGLTIDDLRNYFGDKVSEAELYGYLKALDEPWNAMVANAKAGLAGDAGATDAAINGLKDFFGYAPKFRQGEVTAGRSVEILKSTPPMKSITDVLAGLDPDSIAKMDFEAAKKTILENILSIDKDKLKAAAAARDRTLPSPTFWTKMKEVYVNLLLAPPVSQVRNFIGNSYAAVNSMAERELAGWLSIDDAKGIVKGEGMAQFQGMMAGVADGISAFASAFKGAGAKEAGKLDVIPHAIGGTVGRIINGPGDTLRGMDNFFKTILQRGDLYAQALQNGSHLGLTGRALADYAARHVDIPTTSMLKHAEEFAKYQTFQNDLGTLGKWAQGIQKVPGMSYLFPFMKTPMNLAKFAWNRTPGLQFLSSSLYKDILAGGERADLAIARLTMSNLMGMFWFGLAKEGLLTGGGPVDPTLRRSWLGTKQPYSILGKDGWYPITNMEPFTTTLNLIADFADIHNQLDDPTAEQTAMVVALAGVRDIADKSYWQTVGQIVDFIGAARSGEEPGRQALQVIQSPFITAASGGPLGAGFARAMDPVRREARIFVDQIMARTPGYSKELPPMRDGYGDPILVPAPIGGEYMRLLSPFVHQPEQTDRVKKEGAKLQAKLPMFPWSLGGKTQDEFDIRSALPGDKLPVELTPEQRDRWQVLYRNILRNPQNGIEKKLLDTPEYQNAPFAAKRDMFMNFLAQARAASKDLLIADDTELQKKAIKSEAAQVLPMLNEDDRPQAEQQALQALDAAAPLTEEERANISRWGYLDDGKKRDNQMLLQRYAIPQVEGSKVPQ